MKPNRVHPFVLLALSLVLATPAVNDRALAGEAGPAPWLRDRGPGTSTSMFGTYVERGERLLYVFYEPYVDSGVEYRSVGPAGAPRGYRGEFEAHEALLMAAYGITDRLAVELEGSVIRAELERSPSDPAGAFGKLVERGIGNIEGQLRMRWLDERARRPELFGYFEAVAPTERNRPLIGTPGWEFGLGTGLVKGTRWGTFTTRGSAAYSAADGTLELGEYALEYLRRLSPGLRAYAGLEGGPDELSFITEAQVRLTSRATLKLNNAVGLTRSTTDWAPEMGVVFSFPAR